MFLINKNTKTNLGEKIEYREILRELAMGE